MTTLHLSQEGGSGGGGSVWVPKLPVEAAEELLQRLSCQHTALSRAHVGLDSHARQPSTHKDNLMGHTQARA